jgi:hypothetical protein
VRITELLAHEAEDPVRFHLHVNAFADAFRKASPEARHTMVEAGPARQTATAGLVAAVVSALCREVDMVPPDWVARTASPEPYFAFGARSFALRVRLMLESPAPFRIRNVFVPRDYLSRA